MSLLHFSRTGRKLQSRFSSYIAKLLLVKGKLYAPLEVDCDIKPPAHKWILFKALQVYKNLILPGCRPQFCYRCWECSLICASPLSCCKTISDPKHVSHAEKPHLLEKYWWRFFQVAVPVSLWSAFKDSNIIREVNGLPDLNFFGFGSDMPLDLYLET